MNWKEEFLNNNITIEELNVLRKRSAWNEWENNEFKNLLLDLFLKSEIPSKYTEILLGERYLSIFLTAFTHPSVSDNNYEMLEFLGDLTYNKSVGYYILRRYPQLFVPEAKGLVSRLKIFIIQSKMMASISRELGFIKFIKYDPTKVNVDINKIAEDVFEAVFGALEWILDSVVGIGIGNLFCYKLVTKLLDRRNFSLSYIDIVDPYTILKEIFDKYKSLGTQKIVITKLEDRVLIKINQTNDRGLFRILAEGEGKEQDEAKNKAARLALKVLESEGYKHPDLDKYEKYIIKN